jgi:hypothetical protein
VEGGPGLRPDQVGGLRQTKDPDPVELACGLGRGGEGYREGGYGEAADESAPVHQRITSSARRGTDADGRWTGDVGPFACAANARG